MSIIINIYLPSCHQRSTTHSIIISTYPKPRLSWLIWRFSWKGTCCHSQSPLASRMKATSQTAMTKEKVKSSPMVNQNQKRMFLAVTRKQDTYRSQHLPISSPNFRMKSMNVTKRKAYASSARSQAMTQRCVTLTLITYCKTIRSQKTRSPSSRHPGYIEMYPDRGANQPWGSGEQPYHYRLENRQGPDRFRS